MAQQGDYTILSQREKEPLNGNKIYKCQDQRRIYKWLIFGLLAAFVVFALNITQSPHDDDVQTPLLHKDRCPQFPAIEHTSEKKRSLETELREVLSSDEFFANSTKRMQGAVRIPTESFDDMGEVGEDVRWEVLIPFREYLKKTFPLVYSQLEVTYINTYGLLIEWKGKDESLKPYLFMGHQDIVPVLKDTESRWKYPPYSAHFDGRFIWGRGTADCKNVVIGILEAFELLLERDHTPERTMLVAFGFDEEISGWHGAAYLSKHLLETRGKDSIDLVIDEGGLGIKELYGTMFVLPGLGEKGYQDIRITVETNGGHSSVPPDHTGIGILSRIVAAIEDHPYEPTLTPVNPYFTTLQCGAEHGSEMDPWLRKTIKAASISKKAAKSVADYLSKADIRNRYLMQTSQATDLVSGGVKVNALPEKVYAVVNHRIGVESRIKDTQHSMSSLIESQILNKFSMTLDSWGTISGNISSTTRGKITLEHFGEPLEPSPVSPFDTDAYKTFTGTIKQVFGKEYVVAPSLMTGNTDTKYYWSLSRNIYRFSPTRDEGRADAHTVNERMGMKEHIEGVRFYVQMVLNGDPN